MKSDTTIALLVRDFAWGGGVELLRFIAHWLLVKQQAFGLKIYLLLPVDNRIDAPLDILRICMRSIKGSLQRKELYIAKPLPAFHKSVLDYFKQTQEGHIEIVYYENSDNGFIRCLQRIKADVALPVNGSLGEDFPIPWVGYMYDFQHKYLSENFTSRDCLSRDIAFATTLRDSPAIIVNSHAVKEDIFKFFPYTEDKIFNMPFAPHPQADWLEPYTENVGNKYQLPEKYFLISNQFWIHKDHLTAFKTLKLNDELTDIGIVCTGAMGDKRRPEYMQEINKYIADNGLADRIKLLGHIPKRDQIEIMKNALAVVQPTLFEGGPGGGSVYDAVSLGVPVILSDIPVNKEVVGNNICFFKSGDSVDLAEKMCIILKKHIVRPTLEELLETGRTNLEILGDRLLEAVSYAMDKTQQSLSSNRIK